MTTEFDVIFVPLAFDLIEEFGKTVTFTDRAPETSYNPKAGSVSAPLGAIYPNIKIIPPDRMQIFFIAQDLKEEGELVTGVAAKDLPFTPINGMTIDLDGDQWTVTKVDPIYSGDEIALYLIRIES